MAWILRGEEPLLCFIHIPKTSGNWVRSTLVDLGMWSVREPMGWTAPSAHGMPDRWDYPLIFTVIREPADYLRSTWGSRIIDGWRPHPEKAPWQAFCSMVDQYKSTIFEEFALGVAKNLPGVIGWLYGAYTPPPVKVVKYGPELYDFLEGLGGNPKDIPAENVDKTHGMKIDPAVRDAIYSAEYQTYLRYGWL